MLATAARILLRRSDVGRWGNLASHDPAWDERTRIIASLIPRGSKVLEFGAGRRSLQACLDPTCSYVPSDLVSRGPDTLVCDLNRRPLPDLSDLGPDVAVFGGVLEYIAKLEDIPRWLAAHVRTCIASYECARTAKDDRGRFAERRDRAAIGWLSTFNEQELLALFAESGFQCREKVIWHTPDGDEPIFVFERSASSVAFVTASGSE
jgi:hypothetical protein